MDLAICIFSDMSVSDESISRRPFWTNGIDSMLFPFCSHMRCVIRKKNYAKYNISADNALKRKIIKILNSKEIKKGKLKIK